MANHASARRRIRKTAKRTVRNKHIRSTVRSRMRLLRAAVKAGDATAAEKLLADARSHIDSAVAKGVYPRKTGSRYISRLSTQVIALKKKA